MPSSKLMQCLAAILMVAGGSAASKDTAGHSPSVDQTCSSNAGDCEPDMPPRVQGAVALTDSPFCPFFVVVTAEGFTFLKWQKGWEIHMEGDEVIGPLHSLGSHKIELPFWRSELDVQVEEVRATISRAQEAFYARCAPADGMSASASFGAIAERQ